MTAASAEPAPSDSTSASGWTEPRIAAPTTGPAAIPRKVSAAMTPSARGRAAPANRCAAAAVPTGTRTPPPIAWTTRAAMSWSSDCDAPARTDPIMNTTRAPLNNRRAPHRSARRPASGIVTMYTRR